MAGISHRMQQFWCYPLNVPTLGVSELRYMNRVLIEVVMLKLPMSFIVAPVVSGVVPRTAGWQCRLLS